MHTTWKPHEKHGDLTERSDLPDSVFAFPKQRKEPLTDASHVRNAIARFDQTVGVSDADRELAFANIKKAAEHYGVDMPEKNWKELGSRPSTGRTKEDREASARQGGGNAQRSQAPAPKMNWARSERSAAPNFLKMRTCEKRSMRRLRRKRSPQCSTVWLVKSRDEWETAVGSEESLGQLAGLSLFAEFARQQ